MKRRAPRIKRPVAFRPRVVELESRVTPAVAFALSGTNLLSCDSASPTLTQTTAINGIDANETLVGIDF